MKLVSDIRVYRSEYESTMKKNPSSFASKELNAILTRIVMKLRENNFSLADDYDHLYLNFTYSLKKNEIKFGRRLEIKEFSWFQYCDVGISMEEYEQLSDKKYIQMIIDLLKQTLIRFYSKDSESGRLIENCIEVALNEGEHMLMKFKEKKSSHKNAVIYLRCLDSGYFLPLLRVYNNNNELILEKDMPETIDANYIGQILLNDIRIEIRPKKNVFTRDLKPIIYQLD